jgi:hypothetical protein
MVLLRQSRRMDLPMTLTEPEWNIWLGADTRAANDLVRIVENGGKAGPDLAATGFSVTAAWREETR